MPMPPIHTSPLVIMVGMLTVCTGLFLIITRTKAITQTIGYLVLENGIYALGIAVAAESPSSLNSASCWMSLWASLSWES